MKELPDLRTIAWRILGLGHLIRHTDPAACPSHEELSGIGDLIAESGRQIEEWVEHQERTFGKSNKTAEGSER